MKVENTLTSVVLVDENMRIVPEVLDFVKLLELQGKSINTIPNYVSDLKIFYEWLERENLKFYEVRPSNMPSFIEFVDSRNTNGRVSPATLNRYFGTLSSFYRHFEVVGGIVEESPLVKVGGYKPSVNRGYLRHVSRYWDKGVYHYFKRKVTEKIDRKRLSSNIINKYVETIDDIWSSNGSLMKRNNLIFKTLYETGMRIGELLHLRVNDIDYPDPDPNVKTGNIYLIDREEPDRDRQLKSGERTIPVSTNLLKAIDEYVLYHRPYVEGVEHIFVSHSKNGYGNPISRSSVESMFNEISVASKDKLFKLTPHALRHTHASELQDMGVDINVIKERLGHKSIITTSKYSRPSLQTLTKAHERYLEQKAGISCE